LNYSQTHQTSIVYVLSDSIGETGEMVVRAAISQFDGAHIELRRKPYLKSIEQVKAALAEVVASNGSVVYTLVRPELKNYLEEQVHALNLLHVDIMGPVLETLQTLTHKAPLNEPGMIRKVDEAYFAKIEAIEFAVKFDDGKEPRGLFKADIVITGVSRTSKTPLCMYLAHKGIKAANVPLVKEIAPPPQLFEIPASKIIGLTIKPALLYEIRKERLKTMGLTGEAGYANLERIMDELKFAEDIMRRIGCPVIDVSNKATEETASKILEIYRKGVGK
jgi:regulator of PEP synthase PpsR (kinase-PPPase family)